MNCPTPSTIPILSVLGSYSGPRTELEVVRFWFRALLYLIICDTRTDKRVLGLSVNDIPH